MLAKRIQPDLDVARHPPEHAGEAGMLEHPPSRRVDAFAHAARDGIAQISPPHLEEVVASVRTVGIVAGHNLGVLGGEAMHQSAARGIEGLRDSSRREPARTGAGQQLPQANGHPLKVIGIPTPTRRSSRSPRTQKRPRRASIGPRTAMPLRRRHMRCHRDL